MSVADMDGCRRLREYLKPEDLNLDGCVALASAVLSEAAEELASAARQAADRPTPGNLAHLQACRDFYRSDLFTALSCGLLKGELVCRKIIKDALRGRRVEE